MKFELAANRSELRMHPHSRLMALAARQENILYDIKSLSWQLHKSLVCLTFDDGPDPIYTPRILDILREHKIRASFFVTGDAAQYYAEIIERIVDEGHALGNHSYSHSHPWFMSAASARQEVAKASQVIKGIIGYSPRWFRPPFGRLRKAMVDQAEAENMITVLWNRSIIDWGVCGTESGISRRLRSIAAGDIVLMHDAQRQQNRPDIISRQLPGLLESIASQNLVPITLDQISF